MSFGVFLVDGEAVVFVFLGLLGVRGGVGVGGVVGGWRRGSGGCGGRNGLSFLEGSGVVV